MSGLKIFFVITVLLFFQDAFSMGKIECSGLDINIHDAQTMDAIENITIYRIIAIQNNLTLFGFIPLGEPSNIDYYIEKYHSDKNGYVRIPSWTKKVSAKKYLLNETYYFNIDFVSNENLTPNSIGTSLSLFLLEKLRTNEIVLKNNLYKGIQIRCVGGEISDEMKLAYKNNEYGDFFLRKVISYPQDANKKYMVIKRTNEVWNLFLSANNEDGIINDHEFIKRK